MLGLSNICAASGCAMSSLCFYSGSLGLLYSVSIFRYDSFNYEKLGGLRITSFRENWV